MQASSNTSLVSHARTSTTFERDVSPHQNRPPAALQTHSRAMTAPTLSLAIPHNELRKEGPTKKFVIKQGNVIPQEEADEGAESDRSSICHSPGWDDITGKKKKKEKKEAKEKRKMEKIKEKTKTEAPPVVKPEVKPATKTETKAEKKKLETEAMHNMMKKKRLSKPPPTNPRLSKMAMQMERAASSPEILTTADSPEVKVDTKKSPVKTPRSRRGSLDIGFKHLFSSSQSIPALWKHEKTTSPPTPSAKDAPPPSSGSGSGGGFIGGLKLRLSEEAAALDKTRHSISVMKYEEQRGLLDTDQDSTPTASIRTSARDKSTEPNSRAQPVTTTSSIFEESVRTPQQWDAIYAQAGRIAMGGSSATLDDDVPIMQRGKPRKGRLSISSLEPEVSPPLVSEHPKHGSSAAGNSRITIPTRPRTSEDLSSYGPRRSSPPLDKMSQQNRNRSGSRNGREIHNSYVQDQRKQSQDRAIEAFQEECRITNSPDSTSRGRSLSFHSVKSRVSLSTEGASASRVADPDAPALPEGDKAFSFFSDYTPPELHLDSAPTSPMPIPIPTQERKESKGLKGLKNAAKAAFSRSSIDIPVVKPASQSDSRPSSQRAATIGIVEDVTSSPSKVERLPGEDVSLVKDSSRPPSSGRRLTHPPTSSSKLLEHLNGSSPPGHTRGTSSHARTATDSSEEYSTLDEFSNLTTPMASRPQSQKDYPSPIADLKTTMQAGASSSTNSLPQRAKKSAMMSGGLPYDQAMNRSQDSWSRTAMPMDLTDDEERLRTPKADESNLNSSTTLTGSSSNESKSDESSKETAAPGVQRQPSLSRSISTPEMQDLSFLPALKHQALTRPAGKKGRGLVIRKKSGVRVSTNKDLVRPPAIPIPSPSAKSEGSSPDSPTGGAYLRDARLHIPKPPPRSPNRGRFSGDSRLRNSSPQGGLEPIAKMFVICCSCKYFHDMPSKIYECMAKPDDVVEDKNLGVSGVISTSVKCPWCGHGMSTTCCAGYAAVVYLKEKLH